MSGVALIDYGAGNLHSVHNALKAAGASDIAVTADPAVVLAARRIVLPGVGAFAHCMGALSAIPGMIDTMNEAVMTRGRPFLGICVGMQLMADAGHEHGVTPGLGWIAGHVAPLPPRPGLKIPHMGWNDVVPLADHPVIARGEGLFPSRLWLHRRPCRRHQRPWWHRRRGYRARQSGRCAVSPRKKPDLRYRHAEKVPEMATLTVYPAIDLKAGQVVRLAKGDMARATVYGDEPTTQALAFAAAGATHLHVVDLDGAFAGESINGDAVLNIVTAFPGKVQVGGGIRSMSNVEQWFFRGVARVVIGTAALTDPAFVRAAAHAFPDRIVVGVDARDGLVATHGWADVSDVPVVDLARRFEDAGVAALLFTDVGRDGMLTGCNVAATVDLARAVAVPVIASGGVADMGDIRALAGHVADGVEGVITGRALYDGRLDLAAALAVAG